jgi:hypothetical protein
MGMPFCTRKQHFHTLNCLSITVSTAIPRATRTCSRRKRERPTSSGSIQTHRDRSTPDRDDLYGLFEVKIIKLPGRCHWQALLRQELNRSLGRAMLSRKPISLEIRKWEVYGLSFSKIWGQIKLQIITLAHTAASVRPNLSTENFRSIKF